MIYTVKKHKITDNFQNTLSNMIRLQNFYLRVYA